MKSKFIPLILILVFLITFVIFFKGLKNSNIYTPDTNLKIEVPSFKLKSFENDSIVISEKIFKDFKPHGIFNLAADTHVDRSIDDSSNFIKNNVNFILNIST